MPPGSKQIMYEIWYRFSSFWLGASKFNLTASWEIEMPIKNKISFILTAEKSKDFLQSFDISGDGYITKAELMDVLCKKVTAHLVKKS